MEKHSICMIPWEFSNYVHWAKYTCFVSFMRLGMFFVLENSVNVAHFLLRFSFRVDWFICHKYTFVYYFFQDDTSRYNQRESFTRNDDCEDWVSVFRTNSIPVHQKSVLMMHFTLPENESETDTDKKYTEANGNLCYHLSPCSMNTILYKSFFFISFGICLGVGQCKRHRQ